MNDTLQQFARTFLKAELAKLTPENHRIFKLMYSHKDLNVPINDVVDKMPAEKLSWAMEQVKASVAKLEKAGCV